MKLILVIVQEKDSLLLSNIFNRENIRATKLSTTGGFLKSGNTTFIVGIQEERVEEVLNLIKKSCQSSHQYVSNPPTMNLGLESYLPHPVEIEVSGATVFVLPVDQFVQY